MKSKLLQSSVLACGALGLLASNPALAQQTTAPKAKAAKEKAADQQASDTNQAPGMIIVTAQKRAQNVQTVPVAVTVLSGKELATAPVPGVASAVNMVPSLNFLQSGTTLNQTIFLRGVGTASFSIAGEPSVSTVVDGVVYARSGEAFSDMIDIARMEVLRGPQGTLFGKNASAGVINIVTQKPVDYFTGSVSASYFDRNEIRTKAMINVPLGQNLAARFVGFYGHYDGYIYNEAVNHYVNGYKHYGGRLQVLYNPSDKLKLYFIADYHKNNDDCCADIIATPTLDANGQPAAHQSLAFQVLPTPHYAETRKINQNLVTATKETGWGLSFEADVGIGSQTLTSITSYRKWDNTEIRDGDWLPNAYAAYDSVLQSPEYFIQLHDYGPEHTHTFTQEFRITSPADQFISYVAGLYYSDAYSERTFIRNDIVCGPLPNIPADTLEPCGSQYTTAPTYPNGSATFGSTMKNISAYGQFTVNATKSLRFIGGLRFSRDRNDVFHKRVSPLPGPGIRGNFDQGVYDEYLKLVAQGTDVLTAASQAVAYSNGVPFRTGTTNDNLSGKAAIQYDFTPHVMGYASYTRGYKGPAYNIFYNLDSNGTNVIAPETSDAYEVGLKNTLFGGLMTFNIDAFYAKYYNFQANNPDVVEGVVVTRFTNAGNISTRGVEADVNWLPLPDLSINAGLAYTNAHVDKFKQPPGTPNSAVIQPGTPLGYAPKWKGSMAVNYRWRTNGPVDVFLGAQGNFQSSELSIFSANPVQRAVGTIGPYGLLNLSVGIGDKHDKYRLTFQVRNVFDKAYAAAIVPGGVGGTYRYQIPRGADRYWGVTGKVNF